MAAKSKGLGKGLGTLFGDVADLNLKNDATSVKTEDLKNEKMVKIRLVEPNRDQPRKVFDEEQLQELAESIRKHGVIQPLIVMKRGEHYEIIAGERRWRAAKLAGLKEVPVIEKEYTDEEIAEIALIENIQRTDLNPVEEARAYKKLIEEYHLTQEELSERISKNRSVIANALRLLRLPDEVLDMLSDGSISTGHAKVLLSIENPDTQVAAAKLITEQGLSVRALETYVKGLGKEKTRKKKDELPNAMEYEQAASNLVKKLGTRVKISRKTENSGKIEIDYYSLEDIERIMKHIR